jgi:hypothetical protein
MTAATKAIVILVDMVIFSSCRKQSSLCRLDRAGRRLFPACFEIIGSVYVRAFARRAMIVHFYLIARCGVEPAALPKAISDHCVPAESTSREDGRHPASHLLMLLPH